MQVLILFLILLSALIWSVATISYGQTSGTQRFSILVPTSATVTAPPDVQTIQHDPGSDQDFPTQIWIIRANSLAGTSVDFSVDQPFVHTTDSTHKADVQLALSTQPINGAAQWTVTQAIDMTRFTQGDSQAMVQVQSDGVGAATCELDVRFLVDPLNELAVGTFELVVVATIAVP